MGGVCRFGRAERFWPPRRSRAQRGPCSARSPRRVPTRVHRGPPSCAAPSVALVILPRAAPFRRSRPLRVPGVRPLGVRSQVSAVSSCGPARSRRSEQPPSGEARPHSAAWDFSAPAARAGNRVVFACEPSHQSAVGRLSSGRYPEPSSRPSPRAPEVSAGPPFAPPGGPVFLNLERLVARQVFLWRQRQGRSTPPKSASLEGLVAAAFAAEPAGARGGALRAEGAAASARLAGEVASRQAEAPAAEAPPKSGVRHRAPASHGATTHKRSG